MRLSSSQSKPPCVQMFKWGYLVSLMLVGSFSGAAVARESGYLFHSLVDTTGNRIECGLVAGTDFPLHKDRGEAAHVYLRFTGFDGVLAWEQLLYGAAELRISALAKKQGYVVLTGTFTGLIDLGAVQYESFGHCDAFFAVYEAETGALVWAGQSGGEGCAVGQGLMAHVLGLGVGGSYEGTGFLMPLPLSPARFQSFDVSVNMNTSPNSTLQLRVTAPRFSSVAPEGIAEPGGSSVDPGGPPAGGGE